MNQLEMLQALMENPYRMAKMIKSTDGNNVAFKDALLAVNDNKQVIWKKSLNKFVFCIDDNKSKWEIIEPKRKLKEMCFGEAYHWWSIKDDVNSRDVKSVSSGLSYGERYNYCIPKEEMMGKWTIKGIYDESEDK